MIPLVVVDLDGTIVGKDGQVQDCVWQAVARLSDAGVLVAACTGRPAFGVAMRLAARLGPNNPHVFQSGAHIGFPDGPTLKASSLREQDIRSLIEVSRKTGAVLEVYTPSSLFVERKTKLSEDHAKLIGVTAIARDLEDVAQHEPVVRAQWVVPVGEEQPLILSTPATVTVSHGTSPALPGVAFVNLTRQAVSKASAVSYIADYLRVPLEDVMGIGDSAGDLPMLEVVGHPRVMANSSPEVLERFGNRPGNIVGDVEQCGAVRALDEALHLRTAATR